MACLCMALHISCSQPPQLSSTHLELSETRPPSPLELGNRRNVQHQPTVSFKPQEELEQDWQTLQPSDLNDEWFIKRKNEALTRTVTIIKKRRFSSESEDFSNEK
jgi:hypothetical protein